MHSASSVSLLCGVIWFSVLLTTPRAFLGLLPLLRQFHPPGLTLSAAGIGTIPSYLAERQPLLRSAEERADCHVKRLNSGERSRPGG